CSVVLAKGERGHPTVMESVGRIFEFSAGNAVDGLLRHGNFVTKGPSEARFRCVASLVPRSNGMAIRVELTSTEATQADVGALVVPVYAGGLERQKHFTKLDSAVGQALSAHAAALEFKANLNQVLDFPTAGKLPASRVVLVGLGPKKGGNEANLRHAIGTGVRVAINVPNIGVVLPEGVGGATLRAVAEGA